MGLLTEIYKYNRFTPKDLPEFEGKLFFCTSSTLMRHFRRQNNGGFALQIWSVLNALSMSLPSRFLGRLLDFFSPSFHLLGSAEVDISWRHVAYLQLGPILTQKLDQLFGGRSFTQP